MPRTKLFTLLIILIMMANITLVSGMQGAAVNNTLADGTQELLNRLDAKLPELLKQYSVPGVQIAVIDGDKVWTKEYGYADESDNKKVTADTVFQVGSISKTVTAWGVMKLVDEGKIDLDAPVEKYIKRWNIPESQYDSAGVTVRRLLSHTAGLSLQGYAGVKPGEKLATLEESLSGETGGAGDVRIIYEPGSKFQYSGGGYTLLQLVIEEVSGMSFEKYMEQEILKPLGMESSAFEWREDLIPETAKSYGVLGQTLPNYIFTEKAAAGLYTTASDLARFALAGINMSGSDQAGRGVLKPETAALMQQSVKNANWGLGYSFFKLPDGRIAVGHGGANRGWRAQFYIIPDSKQGVVMLTNSDTGDNFMGEVLAFWIEQLTGKLPVFYYNQANFNTKVLIAAGAMGTLLLVFIAFVTRSITKKRRAYAEWKKLKLYKKAIRLLWPVILLIAWWVGLYAPVIHGWNVAEFLPISIKWVTTAFTLWGCALVTAGIFPKVKNKGKINEAPGELQA